MAKKNLIPVWKLLTMMKRFVCLNFRNYCRILTILLHHLELNGAQLFYLTTNCISGFTIIASQPSCPSLQAIQYDLVTPLCWQFYTYTCNRQCTRHSRPCFLGPMTTAYPRKSKLKHTWENSWRNEPSLTLLSLLQPLQYLKVEGMTID